MNAGTCAACNGTQTTAEDEPCPLCPSVACDGRGFYVVALGLTRGGPVTAHSFSSHYGVSDSPEEALGKAMIAAGKLKPQYAIYQHTIQKVDMDAIAEALDMPTPAGQEIHA